MKGIELHLIYHEAQEILLVLCQKHWNHETYARMDYE